MAASLSQKRRLACDRCHLQKSRCPKTADSQNCTRCLKVGVPCVYSLSLRKTRDQNVGEERNRLGGREGSEPDPLALMMVGSDGLGTFDPFLGSDLAFDGRHDNFNDMFTNISSLGATGIHWINDQMDDFSADLGANTDDQTNSDNTDSTASIDGTDTASQISSSNLSHAERLANLSVSLSEHIACLPPPSKEFHMNRWPGSTSKSTTLGKYTLDESLQLTQTLLGLYEEIISLCPSQSPQPMVSTIEAQVSHPPGPRKRPVLDISNLYLLVSCTHRILDVWQLIFQHSRVRISLGLLSDCTSKNDTRGTVRVGSFVPTPDDSAKMKAFIMTSLVTGIHRNVKKTRDTCLEQAGRFTGETRQLALELTSVFEGLLKRTQTTVQEMEVLQNAFLQDNPQATELRAMIAAAKAG